MSPMDVYSADVFFGDNTSKSKHHPILVVDYDDDYLMTYKITSCGNDRQKIISYLENNSLVSRSQVEKLLVIKSSQANRYLHILVQADIIQKVGSSRNTRYELVHKGPDH